MEDMPRKLPLYVYRQTTRHGRAVFYFRKGKGKRIRLPDYGADDFDSAYKAALTGIAYKHDSKHPSKTIGWLIDRYMESREWAALEVATRKQRGNIFKEVIDRTKNAPFSQFTTAAMKRGMITREATPAQANNYLKAMNMMFSWALKHEHVKINPCIGVDRLIYKTDGFVPWQAEDVRQYCAKWKIGTVPRLALELLLISGLRRSDIVKAGKQHMKGQTFTMRTQKTGATVTVEFPQRLIDVIEQTPTGDLHFITNAHGGAFTVESFGNWFRERCREAGVHKSAHGVRKLSATMAANGGATAHELMAQFGWTNSKQAETYTKGADRIRLGVKSSRLVAEQIEDIMPLTDIPSPLTGDVKS